MIVYSSTKTDFRKDILSNDIENIIRETFYQKTGHNVGLSELMSWKASLPHIDRILEDSEIPGDIGVAIEYHIPQSSKRIDVILTGQNSFGNDTAILIELKQWQEAGITDKDGVVTTRFKHGLQETTHPSYQVWSYKKLLQDFNSTVDEDGIQLYPCAYLHNYTPDDVIQHPFYKNYIDEAPVFLKPDALKLREFVKEHVKKGDQNKILYRIENGKIRPSKNLADELVSLLKGNEEFTMIDDQKVVFETAKKLALSARKDSKKVLIVEGGPGTGKSVVAINLLVQLSKEGLNSRYVTRNSAPREVYGIKLTGTFRRTHIANLFSGSGSFHSIQKNTFDTLIVDEAHRLNEKSGMFNHLGENQIKEIIDASLFSIFFIDEDQKVTLKDIGSKEEIRKFAEGADAEIVELSLESQFRCNGSDGYLAWLDNMLQIRETANETLEDIDYDFQIFDTPGELHKAILKKNKEKNKARMLAGYCWNWVSKKNPLIKDIVIGDYKATWNLDKHGQAFIIHPDSVSEVGCIHTSQGLEVDYVGVIVGPDMIFEDGKIITIPENRARTDKSIQGWKKMIKDGSDEVEVRRQLDLIIKNTYRTLMTRGQKGCYVYFCDENLKHNFGKINII